MILAVGFVVLLGVLLGAVLQSIRYFVLIENLEKKWGPSPLLEELDRGLRGMR